MIFSDDASDPHSVSGESASYRVGSGGNSVNVKVVDQYGDGMRNVAISVNSNLDVINSTTDNPDQVVYPEEVDITVQAGENRDGDTTAGETTSVDRTNLTYATFVAADPSATPPIPANRIDIDPRAVARGPATIGQDDVEGTPFKTRRNGTYRIGYVYTGTSALTETITPEAIQVYKKPEFNDAGDGVADLETSVAQEVGDPVKAYWAKTGNSSQSDTTSGGDSEPVPVLVPDVANRTIVANEPLLEGTDTDNPMAYFYDEDDLFIVGGFGVSFETFEEALGLTWKDNKVYPSTVEWENYAFTRPGRVSKTIWRIELSCTEPTG